MKLASNIEIHVFTKLLSRLRHSSVALLDGSVLLPFHHAMMVQGQRVPRIQQLVMQSLVFSDNTTLKQLLSCTPTAERVTVADTPVALRANLMKCALRRGEVFQQLVGEAGGVEAVFAAASLQQMSIGLLELIALASVGRNSSLENQCTHIVPFADLLAVLSLQAVPNPVRAVLLSLLLHVYVDAASVSPSLHEGVWKAVSCTLHALVMDQPHAAAVLDQLLSLLEFYCADFNYVGMKCGL